MGTQWEPGEDVLDTRSIAERLEELQSEEADDFDRLEYTAAVASLCVQLGVDRIEDQEDYDPILILDSYFKEYAMELADDIGALPKEYSWPTSCIDWNQAARELSMDYTLVSFGGFDYWVHG